MSKTKHQKSKNESKENVDIDISDLSKFIKECYLEQSLVKMRKYEEEKFILFDFSFRQRYEEDNLYQRNPILIDKIRRGNSILVLKDQDFSIKYKQALNEQPQAEPNIEDINGKMMIARRGLQKFFDLDGSYIQRNIDNTSALAQNGFTSEKLQEIIFSELKKKNCPVRVYRMEKANGENCQIAYNEDLDLWLICSKNVCMPVRNKNDLEKYKKKEKQISQQKISNNEEQTMELEEKEPNNNLTHTEMEEENKDNISKELDNEGKMQLENKTKKQYKMEIEKSKTDQKKKNPNENENDETEEIGLDRFSFSTIIAEIWFEILDNMEKEKPDIINQLKKDLKNKCLIGEYCGNNEHQHLVLYDRIQIRFYAIVELNNSARSCIPPSHALEFLNKYQLTKVDIKEIIDCKDFLDLNQKLKLAYDKVCSSTIEDEGEGNVLYFVQLNEKMEEVDVFSLCKLKTTHYRLFRKMREKLKRMLFDKNLKITKEKKDPLISFKNEIGEFLKKDFCEINFYFTFCSRLFEYSKHFLTSQKIKEKNFKKLIGERYASYITFIMYCLYKEIPLNKCEIKLLMDENFVNSEMNKLSWSEYMNSLRDSKFFGTDLVKID